MRADDQHLENSALAYVYCILPTVVVNELCYLLYLFFLYESILNDNFIEDHLKIMPDP